MLSFKKIHYINCINSSEIYQKDFPEIMKPRVLKDLIRFPILSFWQLIIGFQPKLWFPGRNKIVFFYQSKNNFNTIKTVQEITPNSILLHTIPTPWSKGYLFPTGIAYLIALTFLPLAFYHMVKSKGKYKTAFRAFFNKYWRTYGLIIAYELYLRCLSPKAMILTNDHCREPLIVSSICKEKRIPVFFIPHGSFSGETLEKNPMYFDFALVSGEDQKTRIETALPNCKCYMIGRPLSDSSLLKKNKSLTLRQIGVCINPMDNLVNIDKLCDLIMEKTNVTMVIRPHPSMNTSKLKKIVSSKKIEVSNSISENPIDFLTRVDGIIAGCSSIILDAAEMNVYPIFYDSSRRYDDFNNFVKRGLADFAANPEDCVKLLKQASIKKPNVRINAKYYNGTIGTEYDGKSTILAKELIIKNINRYGSSPN